MTHGSRKLQVAWEKHLAADAACGEGRWVSASKPAFEKPRLFCAVSEDSAVGS